MIETGKVLQNRYRIDKQIGQGGMGAVYVATDERFGSTVAIKETLFMDDNYRKAIEREARLLNSLKHTALPRVSDHFLEENGQFLVMEYIPGKDLFDMIEERGMPFPVDDILKWADQLLDALDFLHNQDMPVIHRDIKPQNLKLTARGQIILLDFGLAKGNPTDAEHQTAAKSIFGYSRNYASLEQIQGTGTDPRSDLYSLAATLYHLVTGVPPEDALTRAMGVLSQRPDPLLRANRINPEVPSGVADVLHAALDLNAAGRPASAAEMRAMLRDCDKTVIAVDTDSLLAAPNTALLAQETHIMGAETVQDGAGPMGAKTAILPAAASQVTAVRHGLTGAYGENTDPSNSNAHIAQAGGPGRRRAVAAVAAAILLLVGSAAGLYIYNPSVFGSAPDADPPVTADVSNVTVNTDTGASFADSAANANAMPVDPSKTEERTSTQGDKPADTTKNGKPSTGGNASGRNETVEVDIDGEEVRIGDTVIRDGKVETPDRIIDENGPRPKYPQRPLPGDPNFRPPIPPEQWEKLTPAQRRKLRTVLRTVPKAPPTQRPTPAPDYRKY